MGGSEFLGCSTDVKRVTIIEIDLVIVGVATVVITAVVMVVIVSTCVEVCHA